MRSIVALTVLVIMLLLVSPLLPRIAMAQPSQGNWVVTGTQVVQNESITLNGNLTIENGGNLTLQGSSFTLNVRRNGQYGIFVQPGGDLYIRSSTIGSADGVHRFVFQVAGNAFGMENSSMSDAGWCDITPAVQGTCFTKSSAGFINGLQGLQVETNGAIIENNSISGSGVGLTLTGFGDLVQGNTIKSSNTTSLFIANRGGGFLDFSNDTVTQNRFYQDGLLNTPMVNVGSGGNIIENNTITYNLVANQMSPIGITDSGWANHIQFNHIMAKIGVWLNPGVSDEVLSHNSLTFCEQGIWAVGGGLGDLIASNTLVPGLSAVCNDVYRSVGMQLQGLHNSVIEDNTLVGPPGFQKGNGTWNPGPSLNLVGAYRNTILDNAFNFSGSEPPLYIIDSSDNELEGNSFSSPYSTGWAGVFLDGSNNNTIFDNSFNSSATQFSVALDGSSSNSFYENNVYSPDLGAYDGGRNNSWSYGGVGNYWSTYSGPGDYRISPNGTDYHPLTKPARISQFPLVKPHSFSIPQPYAGPQCDFSVSNTTVVSDGSSACPVGNIEIKPGGSLTYSHEKLVLGLSGAFNFQIDSGGALYIVDSNVTWGEGNQGISAEGNFSLEGSHVTVENSSSVPLTFTGNGAVSITNSTIRSVTGSAGFIFREAGNCSIGVSSSVLQGGSAYLDSESMLACGAIVSTDHPRVVVKNSLIEDGVSGISTGGQNEILVAVNDTFKNLDLALNIQAGTATVSHDLIYSSVDGLQVIASNVTVSYVTLLRSWTFGISVSCGYAASSYGAKCENTGDTIGNKVSAAYSGLVVDANDTVIAGNVATGPKGLLVVNGNDNDVYGNNVSAIQVNGQGNNVHDNFVGSSSTSTSTTSTTSGSTSTSISISTSTNFTSSTSSNGTRGGIPEFPYQLTAAAVLVGTISISYFLIRRRRV